MSEKELVSRIMTVARIFEPGAGGRTEVVFLESAMFFSVSRENEGFDRVITVLRNALENGQKVDVRLSSIGSDVIEDVRAIS